MSTASAAKGDKADSLANQDATDMICDACGKTGDGLKKCTACKSVRYCDVTCQKRHRKAHKKECKRLAMEVKLDAAVAAALDAREECPICMLPLPFDNYNETTYKLCCGKLLCSTCDFQTAKERAKSGQGNIEVDDAMACMFCRGPPLSGEDEALRKLQELVDRNDPRAAMTLSSSYFNGAGKLQKDERRALELCERAAELDDPHALLALSEYYEAGWGGLERDEKKSKEYLERAASKGHHSALLRLGIEEWNRNNPSGALYYVRVCASLGVKEALEKVKVGYKDGYITKDEFAKTLRSYQRAQDDMHSVARDRFLKAMNKSS